MRSSAAKRSVGEGASGETAPSSSRKKPRLVFEIDEHLKELLQPSVGRGYAGVVRALIVDAYCMFGLPAPIREALEQDMRSRGIHSQRDYVLYLLLERERAVRATPSINGAA